MQTVGLSATVSELKQCTLSGRGDDSGSRAARLPFFVHAIITMSQIMDVSSKMGPWMLRGWVRLSENLKNRLGNSQNLGLNGQRVREVPGPFDEIAKRPNACCSFLCQLRRGPITSSGPVIRTTKGISDLKCDNRVDPSFGFARFDPSDGPSERYGVPCTAPSYRHGRDSTSKAAI